MAEPGEVSAAVFGYLFFSPLAMTQENGPTLSQLHKTLHYHIFEDAVQGNGRPVSRLESQKCVCLFSSPSPTELLELV